MVVILIVWLNVFLNVWFKFWTIYNQNTNSLRVNLAKAKVHIKYNLF